MKFRRSNFKSVPMSDMVKVSYFELLANELTRIFIYIFNQDVMKMTVKDILLLPVQISIIPLTPMAVFERFKRYKEYNCEGSGWKANNITIYWRDVSDFSVKPRSYIE